MARITSTCGGRVDRSHQSEMKGRGKEVGAEGRRGRWTGEMRGEGATPVPPYRPVARLRDYVGTSTADTISPESSPLF